MKDTGLSRFVTVVSVIGSLICLNVLAVQNFVRLDLTADGTFTLGEASVKTMAELEDPIAVKAYFTPNLPPPFSQNAQFVRDLLEEYRAASGGKVSYEFINPEGEETEEDKEKKKEVKQDIFGRRIREQTSIEKELGALGIQPVEIRVIEEDQAQTKRAYMGLVVQYQEETEAIPVVQETASLEYNLTTLIRNLTRTRVPVLGITQGHGEPALEGNPQTGQPGALDQMKSLLSQLYEVKGLDLKTGLEEGNIPDDYDALLVIGPTQPLGEPALKAIDAFVMKGKSATFMLDNASVDLRTFQVAPVESGLTDLIATYGIEMGPKLVADAEASSLMVTRQMRGMRVQMPLRYPFVPALRTLEPGSPVTRGIAEVTLPFVAPLYLGGEVKELKAEDKAPVFNDDAKEGEQPAGVYGRVLAKSSPKSWLEDATPENLSPNRFTGRVTADPTGPYNLIASVQGKLKSHYGVAGGGAMESEGEARVIVVGSSGLMKEQFLSQPNAALALNIIDWMLLDPALLKMRTRGLLEAPIDPELSDGARAAIKWGNVVGLPAALLIFGFFMWRMREARRKRLAAAV
jgi:gliding-associated putative ABC transporter substrate-binding component GldG